MSEPSDDLSPSADNRIEDAYCRFERALKDGAAARIENFLGNGAGTEQSALLRELVMLEIEYRRRRGEAVTANEYRQRFPDHADEIATWFPAETATTATDSQPPPSTHPWPKVPGYEIRRELGRGGMGVVYEAWHEKLQRVVALKMILAGGHASAEQRRRLLAEARAVARLKHPNIVQIYDIGEHDGLPYFSMEYVEGGSLADRLKTVMPSDMEAARLVELLASTVHYAHGQGVIHRDLKPANILLTGELVPKIADFGLAKFLDDEHTATLSGAILGTASYMAPEQAAGRTSEIGPRTDVYALGAILYELLTGRVPFRADSVPETLRRVMEDAPQKPSAHNRVDAGLECICMKCLEKEANNRYPSAQALADDLSAFVRGEFEPPTSNLSTRLFNWIRQESPLTEVMQRWSRVWIALAINGFFVCVLQFAFLWYDIQSYWPYYGVWLGKLASDLSFTWFFCLRDRKSAHRVERQLTQVWGFFWVGHFFMVWLVQRTGMPVASFIPLVSLEFAIVLSTMGAILGGSFYLAALLAVTMAILDALWPGAGQLFGAVVAAPAIFLLGWKHMCSAKGENLPATGRPAI